MAAKRSGRRGRVLAQRDPPQNEASDESDEEIVSPGSSRATTPQPTDTLKEIQPLDTMESQPTTQKRKKASPPLYLTEQQEQNIADWYRSHEILYNRRLKKYKQADVKMRLFEEKASQLDPPCAAKQLKVWIVSMRTSLGKLTRKKPGQQAKEFTDRQEWILENFGYLTDHIKRIGSDRRKQGGQVHLETILPGPSKVLQDSDDEMWDEWDEEYTCREEDESNPTFRITRGGLEKKATKCGPFKKSRKTIEELPGEVDQMSNDIQSQIQPQMDSVSQCKRHFAEMLFHETMQMDEHTWNDYQMQAFQLLMQFKQQRLRPRQPQEVFPGTMASTSCSENASQMFPPPRVSPAVQSYTQTVAAQLYPPPASAQSVAPSHSQATVSPLGSSTYMYKTSLSDHADRDSR